MTRTIAAKMMLRPGTRAILLHAPAGLLEYIEAPSLDIHSEMSGEFGYIHIFACNQKELTAEFSVARKHVAANGALWVSWPKGRKLGTDLNLHEVVRIAYGLGMVESTCIRIDDTWSALRFTHPKPGKTYSNGHAELVTI